jgi:hypothetical protein
MAPGLPPRVVAVYGEVSHPPQAVEHEADTYRIAA